MTVWEIAVGVLLGISLFRLIDMLIELPFAYARYRRAQKKHREFLEFMDKSVNDLMQHIKNDVANRKVENAKYSGKKAKTSTRSKATAGTKKARVQKVKKGV